MKGYRKLRIRPGIAEIAARRRLQEEQAKLVNNTKITGTEDCVPISYAAPVELTEQQKQGENHE